MEIIKNNPYRIVGLLAGATTREQDRQIKRLKQFLDAEQSPEDDFSFPALGGFNRTIDSVDAAASKLNLNNDRINAAMFWFWNGNPITDEAAFDALKAGDINSAIQIWDKLTIETTQDGKRFWKPITERNYSAFHNFFVINMMNGKESIESSIIANLHFLENDLLQKFVISAADETYKASKRDLQIAFLNQLIQESNLPQEKLIAILNNQDFVSKEEFFKQLAENFIQPIEQEIEKAKTKRKESKNYGIRAGQLLYDNTHKNLATLKSFLDINNLKYISIADKVANEILQCSIDFFNANQEESSKTNYFDPSMKLAKLAEKIAAGNLTKNRVKESIKDLEETKEIEIDQAIELLQSVKDAFEKNENEILAHVRRQEANLGWNETINWGKVQIMIQNSIDWGKVTELILSVIPNNNVEKIKLTNNPAKVNKYKSLVDFIMQNLSFTNRNRVKYIRYWDVSTKTNTTKPALPTNTTTNPANTKNDDSFKFRENAWWIGGLIGLGIGAAAGGGVGALIGAVVGAIVASKL